MKRTIALFGIILLISLFVTFDTATSAVASDYDSIMAEAKTFESKGEVRRALDLYMKAAEIDPLKADPWAHASILYVILENEAGAIEAANKAIELEPDNKIAWTNKSATEIYLGRFQLAIMTTSKALSKFPEDPGLMNNLAAAYLYTNRTDEAENLLQRVTDKAPDNAKAHYNLACINALKGLKLTALAHLSRAIEIDPSYREVARKDKDLSSLHELKSFRELTQ